MDEHTSTPPPSPPQWVPPRDPGQPPAINWRPPPGFGSGEPKRSSQRYRPGKSDGALIAWTVFCAIWFFASSLGDKGDDGIIFGILFFIWVSPAFMLTVIYLIARAGRRRCPVCGTHLKTGLTRCWGCGHDFAAAAKERADAATRRGDAEPLQLGQVASSSPGAASAGRRSRLTGSAMSHSVRQAGHASRNRSGSVQSPRSVHSPHVGH